jgi:hypothetical protein
MGLEVIMFQEADWPRLASVLAGSAMESDIAVAVAPSNLHREHMRTAQGCNRQLRFHMHEGGTVNDTSLFQRPVRCLQPWHMRRKASALLQLRGLMGHLAVELHCIAVVPAAHSLRGHSLCPVLLLMPTHATTTVYVFLLKTALPTAITFHSPTAAACVASCHSRLCMDQVAHPQRRHAGRSATNVGVLEFGSLPIHC